VPRSKRGPRSIGFSYPVLVPAIKITGILPITELGMSVSQITTNQQIAGAPASLEAKRVQLQALMFKKALELQQTQPAASNEEAEGKGQLLDVRC
jgi:hypothetical protein